jgi:hypothetical protein
MRGLKQPIPGCIYRARRMRAVYNRKGVGSKQNDNFFRGYGLGASKPGNFIGVQPL